MGPTLKADMNVETWIRGKIPPVLDSDGIHKTYDVKYIDLSPLGVPWTWPETHDHAKWGITVDSDWVCVGDINRMVSQEKRGGERSRSRMRSFGPLYRNRSSGGAARALTRRCAEADQGHAQSYP